MVTLRVYTLGRLRIACNETPLQFSAKKSQDLLCYLLLHAGETLERETIAESLWPMRAPGKARRSLSTALWRLHQTLEGAFPADPPYVLATPDTLAFNTHAPYWFDVAAFEQQAAFGLACSLPCPDAQRRGLEEALDLYQGDLLAGCYDDWCLVERERLQLLLLQVLKRLQCHYRLCGAFEDALACGQRLLALDPLQEDVHREMMRCYVAAGQRPLALEQFQRCRDILRRELQTDPMLETRKLCQQIAGGSQGVTLQEEGEAAIASFQETLVQFRHALDDLESAWQSLQSMATDLMEAKDPLEGKSTHPV